MTELNITSGDDIDFSFNRTWLTNSNFYWELDGVNITKGRKHMGTTTNTLTLLNATETDIGTYTLVVSTDMVKIYLSMSLSVGKSQ